MENPWQLYEALIKKSRDSEIATEIVDDIIFGSYWTVLRTVSGKYGAAAAQRGQAPDKEKYIGKNLREIAPLVKSWNFPEASLGLCAINVSLNQALFFPTQENPDAFLRYRERFNGKKVTVVGHFAYLEQKLEGLCDLTVLERDPRGDDLPDPACEYILPEADVVVITGSALINKTMPRLLELSKNAFTIISGPSTPMCDILFSYGADSLCGFCCQKPGIWQTVDGCGSIFRNGQMVCVEKHDALS